MPTELTTDSPLAARLFAWSKERFPPAFILVILPLYGGTAAMAQLYQNGRVHFTAVDLLGVAACTAFLLLLRVFDEHKDYELDSLNHPDRVLQRGLVTLRHLKFIAGGALIVQLAASLWADATVGQATLRWSVVLVWSLLMAKEFFVGEWLSKRLVLYAVSHMLILPMAVIWFMYLGSRGGDIPWEPQLWYAGLVFCLGAVAEVGRKFKAREDEKETIDSYTKTLGVSGASVVLAIVGVAAAGLQLKVISILGGGAELGWGWYVPAVFAALAVVGSAIHFAMKSTPKNAKMVEGMGAGALLILYWGPLIAALKFHNVTFF